MVTVENINLWAKLEVHTSVKDQLTGLILWKLKNNFSSKGLQYNAPMSSVEKETVLSIKISRKKNYLLLNNLSRICIHIVLWCKWWSPGVSESFYLQMKKKQVSYRYSDIGHSGFSQSL